MWQFCFSTPFLLCETCFSISFENVNIIQMFSFHTSFKELLWMFELDFFLHLYYFNKPSKNSLFHVFGFMSKIYQVKRKGKFSNFVEQIQRTFLQIRIFKINLSKWTWERAIINFNMINFWSTKQKSVHWPYLCIIR